MFINHPELLSPIDVTEIAEAIDDLQKRVELCEKVFIKIMQFDTRLHTLEFNSDIPTTPSSAERIMDFEMRLQRLESYLIKPEKVNE